MSQKFYDENREQNEMLRNRMDRETYRDACFDLRARNGVAVREIKNRMTKMLIDVNKGSASSDYVALATALKDCGHDW